MERLDTVWIEPTQVALTQPVPEVLVARLYRFQMLDRLECGLVATCLLIADGPARALAELAGKEAKNSLYWVALATRLTTTRPSSLAKTAS